MLTLGLLPIWLSLLPVQSEAEARHGAETFFRNWENAIARKDPNAIANLMDPAGVTVGLDGSKWSFSRAKTEFPVYFASTRNMTIKIKIDQLSYGAGETVAWITSKTSYEEKQGSSWRKVTRVTRSADTLKQFKSGWKCVYSQDLL